MMLRLYSSPATPLHLLGAILCVAFPELIHLKAVEVGDKSGFWGLGILVLDLCLAENPALAEAVG